MAQDEAAAAEQEGPLRPIAQAYLRHRRLLFIMAVGCLLLGFNGQWIVERDTSMYRGLGHTLATGQGYTFGEFASSVIYPGLPLILAGLEITFGETALPAIVLMNLIALATLVITYRLVRLHFPEWIAIAVTVGVALNARFVQVAQEIMTDIPFLLGVMLFLYGWERLKLAFAVPVVATPASPRLAAEDEEATQASQLRGRGAARALAYLIPGLVIALSMRPTFWILAVAWGLVCVWGLLRGPGRGFYATCLGLVFLAGVAFFFLDPRTRGFNPLGGGYETQFLDKLTRVRATVGRNLPDFITRQFSEGFFSGRFGKVLTPLITIGLVGMTYALLRRGLVLWGLLILCTIGITMLVEVVPRYYLMIVPVMMVAYVLTWRAIGIRAGPRWGPAVFVGGVALLVIPNVVRIAKFVYEQHWADPGRRITWQRSLVAAEMIKENVPIGAAALAPGAPIVSYLSGRDVYMAREIFPEHDDPIEFPRLLAAKGIEYAIWPPQKIRDQEGLIAELMDRGVIVPTGVVEREMGLTLATVEIVVPPDGVDWRTQPIIDYEWVTTTRRGPTSDQIRRQQRLRREAYEARLRRERLELKAKLEARKQREANAAREARERRERNEARMRNEAREARERQAANQRRLKRLREQAATQQSATQQSATQPSSQPATRPATAPAPSGPASMREPPHRDHASDGPTAAAEWGCLPYRDRGTSSSFGDTVSAAGPIFSIV